MAEVRAEVSNVAWQRASEGKMAEALTGCEADRADHQSVTVLGAERTCVLQERVQQRTVEH